MHSEKSFMDKFNSKENKADTSPFFENVAESLKKRGITLEFIDDNSPEDAEFHPDKTIVRVRKGNREEIIEEAFHVRQWEMLEKLGLTEKEKLDPIIIAASEIEIITRTIQKRKKELLILLSQRDKESAKVISSQEHDLGWEKTRLNVYMEKLHRLLEQVSVDDREIYRGLFDHSLFAAAQEVMSWVDQGVGSDEMWGK